MRKIKMGVLGVGEMGKRHAENLRRLVPGAELIAIADVAGGRGGKGLGGVVIGAADKFDGEVGIEGGKGGKDILCEKPLAVTMTDAYATVDAVGKVGVRLQVGFMRRYDPAYAGAMKRIEAG